MCSPVPLSRHTRTVANLATQSPRSISAMSPCDPCSPHRRQASRAPRPQGCGDEGSLEDATGLAVGRDCPQSSTLEASSFPHLEHSTTDPRGRRPKRIVYYLERNHLARGTLLTRGGATDVPTPRRLATPTRACGCPTVMTRWGRARAVLTGNLAQRRQAKQRSQVADM